MRILLYNKIADRGLAALPDAFSVGEDLADAEGILVRSANLHEIAFPPSLRAIARAGAGVNNIPLDRCSAQGIAVFNTPGANANAVKELTLAALLLSARRIPAALSYCGGLGEADLGAVEKAKSAFAGPELMGKTLGVVGLGAIGRAVAEAAKALGMKVVGYDPYAATQDSVETLDEVFAQSDFITLHVPALPETRGLYRKENLAKMKDGVRLLNLARAELAVDEDVLEALESGKAASYYTDFPTAALLGKEGVVMTPHLGASTPEAEESCAAMACRSLADFLENGNVKNSVNFPALTLPRQEKFRIGVLAKAGSPMEPYLTDARVARAQRGDLVYTLCERATAFDTASITQVGGVLRVTSY